MQQNRWKNKCCSPESGKKPHVNRYSSNCWENNLPLSSYEKPQAQNWKSLAVTEENLVLPNKTMERRQSAAGESLLWGLISKTKKSPYASRHRIIPVSPVILSEPTSSQLMVMSLLLTRCSRWGTRLFTFRGETRLKPAGLSKETLSGTTANNFVWMQLVEMVKWSLQHWWVGACVSS